MRKAVSLTGFFQASEIDIRIRHDFIMSQTGRRKHRSAEGSRTAKRSTHEVSRAQRSRPALALRIS